MSTGREDYQARRKARIERMRARSVKLAGESDAAYGRATAISEMIPLGQPILVGHHSEGRHRRDIGRIHASMGRSVEAAKESRELATRADAAEESTAISSDDPEALDKLRAKLAHIDAQRALGVSVNKAIRAAKGDMPKARAAIVALGLSEKAAEAATTPSWCGDLGCPDYRLRNLAANSKRIRERIVHLEASESAPAKADEQIGGVTIREADNRVQLIFPGKPSEEIRTELRRNGFRWSPMAGAWQRMPSARARSVAREIAGKVV